MGLYYQTKALSEDKLYGTWGFHGGPHSLQSTVSTRYKLLMILDNILQGQNLKEEAVIFLET